MSMITVAVPRINIRPQSQKVVDDIPFEHRQQPMRLALPLMRIMVDHVRRRSAKGSLNRTNHPLFDGAGTLCRAIKDGAASWQALDIIYNIDMREERIGIVDRFWIRQMHNAQAVRNRKRIIVKQLREECIDLIRREGRVSILSLASGSAQAVFEGLAGLVTSAIEVLLVDFDKAAGPYALDMAKRYGLEGSVRFKQGNLLKFDRQVIIGSFKPNIVEMAGLLDYLEDDEAVRLMSRIHAILPNRGRLITCHIHDNPERDFMTEVIGWGKDDGRQRPMLYRSRQELVKLLTASGFNTNAMTVIEEPFKIHSVVVAEKT